MIHPRRPAGSSCLPFPALKRSEWAREVGFAATTVSYSQALADKHTSQKPCRAIVTLRTTLLISPTRTINEHVIAYNHGCDSNIKDRNRGRERHCVLDYHRYIQPPDAGQLQHSYNSFCDDHERSNAPTW